MKSKVTNFFLFFLLIVFAFSFHGCSRLIGPSDAEVIKAINESGVFKGGFGGLTLQSPIVILEKDGRDKDGSWPVKVKVIFTSYKNKEQISEPIEKTLTFNLRKAQDSTGHTVWTAALGS